MSASNPMTRVQFDDRIKKEAQTNCKNSFDNKIIETIFYIIEHDSKLKIAYDSFGNSNINSAIAKIVCKAVNGVQRGRVSATRTNLISSFTFLDIGFTQSDLSRDRTKFLEKKQEAATAWFANKSLSHLPCGYILSDKELWKQNVLEQDVAQYIVDENIKRHTWFHHGLSSQAFLFNLFQPKNINGKACIDQFVCNALAKEIDLPQIGVSDFTFEFTDKNLLNEKQSTSLDLYLKYNSGDIVFLESKFTEPSFGRCSVFQTGGCLGKNPATNPSQCYLQTLDCLYWKKMEEYGFLKTAVSTDSVCVFALFYQFFREILFTLEYERINKVNAHFVILHDKDNPAFDQLPKLLEQ